MNSFKIVALVCLAVASNKVHSLPVAQFKPENDFFAGLQLRADENKQSDLVKRRIFEDNPDREIKQISLQSLIGDLEDSLFASALSVHSVVHDKTAVVQEIKPNTGDELTEEHQVNKRDLIVTEASSSAETTTMIPAAEGEERKVILQTTEKVPESAGVPAHIIIDRIAIQPHTGTGVPLIPAFEIKHTHTGNGNSDNGPEITKISISKTEITSVPNTPAPVAATTSTATDATTTPAASITAESESTTAKNIEQLKEAELDLKEKVAEIEAEPVILSARV